MLGVNVQKDEPKAAVFITEGDHVPVIGLEFVEINGKFPGMEFWQYGPTCTKVGVTGGVIVMDMVVTVPH